VLSAYHELSSSPKQEVLKRNLNANNKVLSDCIQLISGQLGADDATQLMSTNAAMNSDLAYNLVILQKTGASPGEGLYSMVRNAMKSTHILRAKSSGKTPSASDLRKLSVQMAYLKHRYLERIYSLGAEASRNDDSEPSIEIIVDDFSSMLKKFQDNKKLASKDDIRNKLNFVHIRFEFLRDSILDYNRKALPFVVNHHATSIIKALLDAAEMAEKKGI
jgi:hypothetical protein